jgi:hypothetical protein
VTETTTTELGSARVIEWDRQARRNAWTRDLMTDVADAIQSAGDDEAVRCVVVRGAGGHFSAGDDLYAAIEADAEIWAATVRAFQRLTRVTLAAPVPVLAAIDGVCIGGALEFAASCDLRIATDRARFGTPEVGIGLVYTNAGSHFMPSTMGETAARELLLTGALGGGVRRGLPRSGCADEGDAQPALRRPARGSDGARGARLHRALRRARCARRAAWLRRAAFPPLTAPTRRGGPAATSSPTRPRVP